MLAVEGSAGGGGASLKLSREGNRSIEDASEKKGGRGKPSAHRLVGAGKRTTTNLFRPRKRKRGRGEREETNVNTSSYQESIEKGKKKDIPSAESLTGENPPRRKRGKGEGERGGFAHADDGTQKDIFPACELGERRLPTRGKRKGGFR